MQPATATPLITEDPVDNTGNLPSSAQTAATKVTISILLQQTG
ncbi:MAG: hypothetical protein U0531_11215 [Dehalococcoidia bacterium]